MRNNILSKDGFTIIELSVVIVVILLIVGSTLFGTGILESARVTSTVNAMQAVQGAVATYQQNYNALPGDDSQMTTRFQNSGITLNGGGDGVIGQTTLAGTFNITTVESGGNGAGESLLAWQGLRAAGLVKGKILGPPLSNAFGGVIGIQNGAFSGDGGLAPGINVLCASGIQGAEARIIDERLDDGDALTGNIRAGVSVEGAASAYDDDIVYVVCMKLL